MNVATLIVGDSGSGKSSSFRNLPPEKTIVLNTERKSLPFKKFSKFKNVDIDSYKKFMTVMRELKDPEKGKRYEFLVIDSLTSLIELIHKYCETVFSGFQIWKEYNDAIWAVLQEMKSLEQQVYITAIPESIERSPGEHKSFAKVKAKEWKCAIEKEFTIVLHTSMDEDEEGNIIRYKLDTRPSNSTSAKSPHEMFEERYIDNDVLHINKAIAEYYE